jgi:hypothetical protein
VAEEPVVLRTFEMTRERPERKKVEKSSDEIAREIGFINEQTLSDRIGRKIRNPKF